MSINTDGDDMTELLYLNDTYQDKCTAEIKDYFVEGDKAIVLLDKTIFYPQGGGQPADRGLIIGEQGEVTIEQVKLEPDGAVRHEGKVTEGVFRPQEMVSLQIDQEKRITHSRAHTAGHLLDVAVREVGIQGLRPTKGYHFPEGPYVEYEGTLEDPNKWIESLSQRMEELISGNNKVIAQMLSSEEASSRGVFAPPGKSARFVFIDGFEKYGCGCGGTHVANIGEIVKVSIRKISSKKGVTRVGYEVVS